MSFRVDWPKDPSVGNEHLKERLQLVLDSIPLTDRVVGGIHVVSLDIGGKVSRDSCFDSLQKSKSSILARSESTV